MNDELQRLGEWEATLQQEVERWQRERALVEAELQRAMKKLELVRQMKSLESDGTGAVTEEAAIPKAGRATPAGVREMAQRILSESARPLHISEIHKEFLSRGYLIPGNGTPFNILAHLVNDRSFVRVARGTYALTGSVPQEQVLPKAERKTRRRKRKKFVEAE